MLDKIKLQQAQVSIVNQRQTGASVSTKHIPEARDRLQSRLLVIVVATLLTGFGTYLLVVNGLFDLDSAIPVSLLLSWTFAGLAWALSAATKGAALAGAAICFLITVATANGERIPLRSGLVPLATLFILTFIATSLGRAAKPTSTIPPAELRHGRNAAQVIANLGMAGLTAAVAAAGIFDRVDQDGVLLSSLVTDSMPVLLLAAFCESTADTVSSEIGQRYGGVPILLITGRKMRPGTNGAITLIGTAAGILAALLVALAGKWSLGMRISHTLMALTAGILGCFFDSLLGATFEREGWLGNDLVNFASTAFAVGAALLMLLAVSP